MSGKSHHEIISASPERLDTREGALLLPSSKQRSERCPLGEGAYAVHRCLADRDHTESLDSLDTPNSDGARVHHQHSLKPMAAGSSCIHKVHNASFCVADLGMAQTSDHVQHQLTQFMMKKVSLPTKETKSRLHVVAGLASLRPQLPRSLRTTALRPRPCGNSTTRKTAG